MRIFVGGVETYVPARWYWAPPGAAIFPSPHGCENARWLQDGEANYDWGEVTRWPKDPFADDWSKVASGHNPGYAGQCSVGDRQWFVDGRLPAGILQLPPQALPACCAAFQPAPAGAGGLVLGGAAAAAHPALQARGGLVAGGSAIAAAPTQPYVGRGGFVEGGSVLPLPRVAQGGLVLGGTALVTITAETICLQQPVLSEYQWYYFSLPANGVLSAWIFLSARVIHHIITATLSGGTWTLFVNEPQSGQRCTVPAFSFEQQDGASCTTLGVSMDRWVQLQPSADQQPVTLAAIYVAPEQCPPYH